MISYFPMLAEELEGFRGQGLVAALKEVPPHFFSDAFDFDSKELWTEMPSVDDKAAQVKYIEKLGQYLVCLWWEGVEAGHSELECVCPISALPILLQFDEGHGGGAVDP